MPQMSCWKHAPLKKSNLRDRDLVGDFRTTNSRTGVVTNSHVLVSLPRTKWRLSTLSGLSPAVSSIAAFVSLADVQSSD